jgi:UDP-arabinose 4-epimerase
MKATGIGAGGSGGSILVVGGAGFVGSQTAKALARAGLRPVVLDNLDCGHQWAVKWGPLERGDLADVARLRQVIRDHRVSAVLHFAAHAYVGESVVDPRKYFRNNVAGTINLLDAMLDEGVRSLVFSSSCTVYGDADSERPLSEDEPLAPVNPYGETKLAVERILHWYGRAYHLGWVALRYFNAAGADPDGELGEDHEPETHLIPLAIGAALGKRPPLQIYGTDYPTADGTAIRDYIHVADLAAAHLRALDHLGGGGPSLALNLGTGGGNSVRQVLAAVERAGGRPVPARAAPRRPGDPAVLVADAARAGEVLGFAPCFSDLDTIVQHAWRWHSTRA